MNRWNFRIPNKSVAVGMLVFGLSCTAALCGAAETNQRDMVLWYRQPAQQWLQAMPLGNGMIGAMVFGGVPLERIALNESSFWSGRPHNYDNPEGAQYYPQIRDLVFADKFQEAEKLANDHFWGKPKSQEAFQPIGDLVLTFAETNVTDYRRELDMETGVAKVSYRSGDAVITRETFVSWPDRVLVMRIGADKPGRVSFAAQFRGPYMSTEPVSPHVGQYMYGTWKGPFSAKRKWQHRLQCPRRQRRHPGHGPGHQLRELP
jgi:alpha-L-fucosidase 2